MLKGTFRLKSMSVVLLTILTTMFLVSCNSSSGDGAEKTSGNQQTSNVP